MLFNVLAVSDFCLIVALHISNVVRQLMRLFVSHKTLCTSTRKRKKKRKDNEKLTVRYLALLQRDFG